MPKTSLDWIFLFPSLLRGSFSSIFSVSSPSCLRNIVTYFLWKHFLSRRFVSQWEFRHIEGSKNKTLEGLQNFCSFFFFLLRKFSKLGWRLEWQFCLEFSTVTLFLPTMINALVIVETVQGPENFVAQYAKRTVQGLKVLLLFVTFKCQLGRQCFAANVTGVTNTRG